ncbi:30S ribosomal protein S9 [Candidatus Micrarchaeota archaeon]|nr:30S ribosomal protein S9 [Candidatus Micrarchaeota archaeon]
MADNPEEPKEEVTPKEKKPVAEKKPEKPEKPKRPKPKKKAKKKNKVVRVEHCRGKRKRSIARATVKEGNGRLRVNSKLISSFGNKYFIKIVEEPLALIGPDGLKVDITVRVHGGGEMGQAQACRTAVARALAKYFGEEVRAKYKEDDSYLLREDRRRVEPKKYMGPKARARNQKSYR